MVAGDDGVRFRGRDGDDNLTGGAGDDILEGDDGDDIYTGGEGADRFVLEQGHDIIMDFDPSEGDDLDGSGPFEVDDPSQVTFEAVTVEGQAATRVVIDEDNSLTLVGFTEDDVLALFDDDGGDGGDGIEFEYPEPPADSVVVTLNQPFDLFVPLSDGTLNGTPASNLAGTQVVLSVTYEGQTIEYFFIGEDFDVSFDTDGALNLGNDSTVSSLSISNVTDEPPQQVANITNLNMSGADVIELIESSFDNDGVVNAEGTAFGDSGRAVVVIGSGLPDEIAIDGAPTYIFTGGSDDEINAGENHDGINIISVEENSDSVFITESSAATFIILDTDGTNASGVVSIDGFRVGTNEDPRDFLVIEDQDGFDQQFIGYTDGNVFTLAGVADALSDFQLGDQFGEEDIGDSGYILVQDGTGNASIASFDITENGLEAGEIFATMTNVDIDFNIDFDTTFFEFVQYVEDTPDTPDFA